MRQAQRLCTPPSWISSEPRGFLRTKLTLTVIGNLQTLAYGWQKSSGFHMSNCSQHLSEMSCKHLEIERGMREVKPGSDSWMLATDCL